MRRDIAIAVLIVIGFTQVACAVSLLGVHFVLVSLMPEQWEIAMFILLMALCVLCVNFCLFWLCFGAKKNIADMLKNDGRRGGP